MMSASKNYLRARMMWLRRLVRLLAPVGDHEDLVQEALIRTELSYTVRAIRAQRAYDKQVVRNLLIDRARYSRSRCDASVTFDEIDHSNRAFVAPDQESTLLLKQVILGLPPIYRDTFILNRFMGLSYVQIGQRYGTTTKAVEYRMSRALALCQEALRDRR